MGQTFEKVFRNLGGFSAIEILIESWVGFHRKLVELIESWGELIESWVERIEVGSKAAAFSAYSAYFAP
jgi:hypothetical protein